MSVAAIARNDFAFAASALLHLGLIGMGIRAAQSHSSSLFFPTDAVEIVAAASLEVGSKQRPTANRQPKEVAVLPHPDTELAIEKTSETQKIQASAASVAMKQGRGGSQAVSQSRQATEWEAYQASIRDAIHEALVYPRASKNLGEVGQVLVGFVVQRDGTIANVSVSEPAAFTRLNDAAVETVRKVARVSPLPEFVPGEAKPMQIPIDFALQ